MVEAHGFHVMSEFCDHFCGDFTIDVMKFNVDTKHASFEKGNLRDI